MMFDWRLVLLALIGLLAASFSLWIYGYASRQGKAWLFAYTACLLFGVQGLSDLGLGFSYGNLYFHLASVILFPSVLISLFVTYIFRGTQEARELLKLLIGVEVGYVITVKLIALLGVEILYPGGVGLDWLRNHFFSTVALIVDFGVITLIWSLWSRRGVVKQGWILAFRVLLLVWLTLVVDTVIFTYGYFGVGSASHGILEANVWVRTALTLILVPGLLWYLHWQEKQEGVNWVKHDWGDVFWREKLTREVEQAKGEIVVLKELQDLMRQKESQLAQQNEELRRFEAAVNQSNEMMIFTDADGVVLWGNPAVEKITGFTVDEAKGRKAGSLWGKMMDKSWYEQLWQTTKVDKKVFEGEIVNHRKSGEKFISQITIYPILDTNQEVKFLVGTQRDVTKEKEVDRMKSEFISIASHELRTPLSAIKWFLEVLLGGDVGELSNAQKDIVKNIDDSNERMIALVNELLGISRVESGKITVARENILVTAWEKELRKLLTPWCLPRQQTLTIEQSWPEKEIWIDRNLINQIIGNLVNNACRYSPEKADIKLVLKEQAGQLMIEVIDHGIGVPLPEQARIFERFFRASNAKAHVSEGTGLGLYWAKTLTNLLGGKIGLESQVGKGTRLWILLPVKETK